MQNIDLSRYSLVLTHDEQIVHTSDQPGLQPLLTCLATCRDRYRDCVLYDRVTGLAAAKLIVYAGVPSTVEDIEPGATRFRREANDCTQTVIARSSAGTGPVGMIQRVVTLVASKPARHFLQQHGIDLSADQIVENILRRDRMAVCPAEQIALDTNDPEVFLKRIQAMPSSITSLSI